MKKIIVIDDDAALRDVITLVFGSDAYSVVCYGRGDHLINHAYEPPDLFILDKQLPGIDGLDLCRYLKQHPSTRHVPVILVSASPSILHLATEAGADGAIEKPFTIHALRQLAHQLLARPVRPNG